MKTITRLLLFLLAVCTVAGVFAACGKKKPAAPDESGEKTEPVTTKEVVTDEWGQTDTQLDIGEKYDDEIKFLVRPGEQYRREWYTEGELTNTLDEKIYSRNEAVSEQLGIHMDFKLLKNDEKGTYTDAVMAAYRAGRGDVDVVSAYAAYSTAVAAMECFVNLNDTERFPKMNFDQPYWNQAFRSTAEVNGYLYTMCGDVNLSVFDRTIVTYLNKDAAARNNIDVDALYETVLDGDWIYEDFLTIVTNIGYVDKDDVEGATDGDFYTLTSIKGSEACDGFLQAFDLKVIAKDTNDNYSLVTGADRAKLDAGQTKIQALFYGSNGAKAWGNSMDNYKCFTSGNAIFNVDVIYHYASGLEMMRSMTDRIGMIPVPKYDADQQNYKASVQDAHNVMAVVYCSRSTDKHYEAVSALLETLCYHSYHDVRPWYFERMVKTKYVEGEADAKVFDLLLASTAWDFADVYSNNLDAPREMVWRAAFRKQESSNDRCNQYETQINENIDKLIKWLEEHQY